MSEPMGDVIRAEKLGKTYAGGTLHTPVFDALDTAVAPGEAGLRAYAHVDAGGVLRPSSFDVIGVPVGNEGIIGAVRTLQSHLQEGTA